MSALSRSKQYCISLTSNAQSFYQNVTASNRSTWFEGVTTNAPTSFIRNLGYIQPQELFFFFFIFKPIKLWLKKQNMRDKKSFTQWINNLARRISLGMQTCTYRNFTALFPPFMYLLVVLLFFHQPLQDHLTYSSDSLVLLRDEPQHELWRNLFLLGASNPPTVLPDSAASSLVQLFLCAPHTCYCSCTNSYVSPHSSLQVILAKSKSFK